MTQVLLISTFFLVSAIIIVPLATRFKLGSVLGYIIAGILIAPLLKIFKLNVTTIQHFAEFGVVMMLFLVGLELEPKVLWKMRNKLIGLGGLQVVLTSCGISLVSMLIGLSWQISLAVGLIFGLSSTAIVLQTLNEKNLMKTIGGESSFSVLLFQDIAVIPMLALIPLLTTPIVKEQNAHHTNGHDIHSSLSLVAGLDLWQQTILTLSAIVLVIVGGSLLARPLFRHVAAAKSREILVATALLLVIGISLMMSLVDLSPALGTFMAGVVLANNEYKHELESDLEPFKGLLLGLFFITVGASIDFALLVDNFALVFGITFLVMSIKGVVLYFLSKLFKIQGSDQRVFAFGLAQAGEFGFVLLSFTVTHDVIPKSIADLLLLVVAMSMLFSPGLFIFIDFLEKFLSNHEEIREADKFEEQSKILIAGHGRVGGIIANMLRSLGYHITVLDHSNVQLETVRKFGNKVYFGDASRIDLLQSAGIESAKIFIIAIDDKDKVTDMVKMVRKHFPNVHIIARAFDRLHTYELYSAGCRDIIRETFDSSIRMGRSALEALGLHPYESERKSQKFVAFDKSILAELAPHYDPNIPTHENKEYISRLKVILKKRDDLMQGNRSSLDILDDRAWNVRGN